MCIRDRITPVIDKKKDIIMNTYISPVDEGFYFEFSFNKKPNIILCYHYYNWSDNNQFEICYTDMANSGHVFGSDQIRTIYK